MISTQVLGSNRRPFVCCKDTK